MELTRGKKGLVSLNGSWFVGFFATSGRWRINAGSCSGSGRLIWNHYSPTQIKGTRARGRGEWASTWRQRGRKRARQKIWLILKEQRALSTQLQPPPPTTPSLSPPFYPSVLSDILPPSFSPAPAERLTRADEKGSSVKGQCWAATPRMPAPVQSNKAGCPPVTGCLDGRTGSVLSLCLSVHWYQ